MAPTKTNKELNDHFTSVENTLESTLSKVESFDERLTNTCSLNQSILQSIQNIDTRLDGISNDVLAKLDDQSVSLTEKIDTTTASIKEDISQIKSVVIAKLQEDNRKLRTRVTSLENRIIVNERNQNQQDQHGRKIYFEVAGIPTTIIQDELKPTLVKLFKNVDIKDATVDDIEVTHRLKSKLDPQPVIVKARRDFIDRVFKKKKSFLEVGRKEELNFGANNKLYINEHLSPACKSLRYNCKLMKNEGSIEDFWVSNAKLKVKFNGSIKIIAHEIDLYRMNPDFDFSFDTEFYASLYDEDRDMDRLDDAAGYY